MVALTVLNHNETGAMRMSEIYQRYQTVANNFTILVEKISPEHWSKSTPCPEWTVRDLVAHVIETHHYVLALLDGARESPADHEEDLARQWLSARQEVARALGDPARAAKVVAGPLGDNQSFETLIDQLVCTDTLLHTWDLARGTGQNERLDPDAVAKAMAFLGPLDDVIRRPGMYGPKILSSETADDQTRLLNFAGRVT